MEQNLTESEWVLEMAEALRNSVFKSSPTISVRVGERIPYGFEVTSYGREVESKTARFQTDLAVVETGEDECWVPRVIVEAKIRTITTHDSITYSQKAASHKAVHPYLRYGVMLGNRKESPLPGRLYRHGANFDFMMSFAASRPTKLELSRFGKLLQSEVEASRSLQKIIYESRSRTRDHYTVFHRKLTLE